MLINTIINYYCFGWSSSQSKLHVEGMGAQRRSSPPLLGRLLGTGMQGSVWQTSRVISEPRSQEREKKVSWIKDFLFYWPGRLLTLDGIENGPY